MTQSLIERTGSHLPVLPEEWRRIGPILTEGLDADYLLIDPGPVSDEIRYTIIELRLKTYRPSFCASLGDILAFNAGMALGIRSSLLVPLNRTHHGHLSHIGALYREERAFLPKDIAMLNRVADRFNSVLELL